MGRRELLEALQREGREAMAAIVASGAAEEERLRVDAEQRREELRRQHEQRRELLCSGRKRTLMARTAREAALIRLRTEHALSLRLLERARICVKLLRRDDGERLFRALAAELPEAIWQSVSCNPADTAAASGSFPGVTITPDAAISGGVIAATADAGLTVDNTLEMRLEKAWPELLPRLVAELRGRRFDQPV